MTNAMFSSAAPMIKRRRPMTVASTSTIPTIVTLSGFQNTHTHTNKEIMCYISVIRTNIRILKYCHSCALVQVWSRRMRRFSLFETLYCGFAPTWYAISMTKTILFSSGTFSVISSVNNKHKAVTIGFFFTDNMFRTLTLQVRWQG